MRKVCGRRAVACAKPTENPQSLGLEVGNGWLAGWLAQEPCRVARHCSRSHAGHSFLPAPQRQGNQNETEHGLSLIVCEEAKFLIFLSGIP
jgi:hypothetical protein